MQKTKILLSLALLGALVFTGFQCASTEITSAKLYIQQKKYDKALESLQKEVEKNPKSDEGYYYMGSVYAEMEKYPEAMDAFNKSLAISDKYKTEISDSKKYVWANLFNKGVSFYQRGSKAQDKDSSKVYYDKSINAFQQAVLFEPDSVDAYRNLAFVFMSEGNNDAAIEPLENLVKRDTTAEGFRFLGQILYTKGTQIRETDSVKAQEYFNRAISVLEQGRKYNPNDSDILLYLSNSYIAANKLDVAVNAFKAGIVAEPNNQYYRYNYGVILLGQNDYAGAEEQFKKAIEIDPEYDNAIYNLAVTYVKWGSAINKAAEDKGEENLNYKEKYQLALPYLEKVVEKRPDDAQVWELLGRVYTILGSTDKATDAFKKADDLRKGH